MRRRLGFAPWAVGTTATLVGVAATIAAVRLRRPRVLAPLPPIPVPVAEPPADAGATDARASVDTIAEYVAPTWSPEVPAAVYAALSGEACERMLYDRHIPFASEHDVPGVDRPVRLTGALHSVAFEGVGLAGGASASPFAIADCRFVLALDDLAARLSERGITTVVYYSMYRPEALGSGHAVHAPAHRPGHRPKAPAHSTAHPSKRASGPHHLKPAGHTAPNGANARASKHDPNQHQHGRAIDIAAFVRADGTRLEVKSSWAGALGDPPCGEGSTPHEAAPDAVELRAIVCGVESAGIFNVILTPNANPAHEDHLHFDITEGAHWFLIE